MFHTSDSSTSNASFSIGSIVRLNGTENAAHGVIRFHGLTSFSPGEWYGVELEEPIGKNDGSVRGIRYFACKPKHGVFVRKFFLTPMAADSSLQAAGIDTGDRPGKSAIADAASQASSNLQSGLQTVSSNVEDLDGSLVRSMALKASAAPSRIGATADASDVCLHSDATVSLQHELAAAVEDEDVDRIRCTLPAAIRARVPLAELEAAQGILNFRIHQTLNDEMQRMQKTICSAENILSSLAERCGVPEFSPVVQDSIEGIHARLRNLQIELPQSNQLVVRQACASLSQRVEQELAAVKNGVTRELTQQLASLKQDIAMLKQDVLEHHSTQVASRPAVPSKRLGRESPPSQKGPPSRRLRSKQAAEASGIGDETYPRADPLHLATPEVAAVKIQSFYRGEHTRKTLRAQKQSRGLKKQLLRDDQRLMDVQPPLPKAKKLARKHRQENTLAQIQKRLRIAAHDNGKDNIAKVFKEQDKDNSGRVDFKEFAALMRRRMNIKAERLSDTELRELFDFFDRHGNGYVEYESEFLTWLFEADGPDPEADAIEDSRVKSAKGSKSYEKKAPRTEGAKQQQVLQSETTHAGMTQMTQKLEEEDELDATQAQLASTKIQATYRGNAARKGLVRYQAACHVIQKAVRKIQSRRKLRAREQEGTSNSACFGEVAKVTQQRYKAWIEVFDAERQGEPGLNKEAFHRAMADVHTELKARQIDALFDGYLREQRAFRGLLDGRGFCLILEAVAVDSHAAAEFADMTAEEFDALAQEDGWKRQLAKRRRHSGHHRSRPVSPVRLDQQTQPPAASNTMALPAKTVVNRPESEIFEPLTPQSSVTELTLDGTDIEAATKIQSVHRGRRVRRKVTREEMKIERLRAPTVATDPRSPDAA